MIPALEMFGAVCAVAFILGYLADHTEVGSGLARAVRGHLPNELEQQS